MLEKVDQTEDDGDDLYDLSDTPRRRQQPDQIEDEEKIATNRSREISDIAFPFAWMRAISRAQQVVRN